jgi:hypothetical protein
LNFELSSLNIRHIKMKAEIIAAIQRAARELGRAPSRGELKRLTGVSHYRVLTQFRSLREAVRAAGLEPSRKGRPVSTEELLRDWKRVKKKLGRRPSRAEYVREGKFSAGTFVGRFGSWSGIFTTEDTEEHRGKAKGSRESTRKARIGRELPKPPKLKSSNAPRHRGEQVVQPGAFEDDKAIAFQWARSLAVIPAPLEGKRRVTEGIAAMIVNTLMPANRNGQLAIGQNPNRFTTEGTEQRRGTGSLLSRRGIYKDRPVMGPPFSRHPLTNAPVNEMGVVFLFALMAWDLGFQVESLWTRGEPDGRAKRLVAPGKWQDVTIEFEYESKNFLRHGHDPKKCDVIVCWKHNWKECPDSIEVIELCRLFE